MKILIVEPMQKPRLVDIPHKLEAMQQIVGGCIQAVYPFDDPVAIVCDDEGKLKGYRPNRYIPGCDVISGTFFVCGLNTEDFTDLTDDLATKYKKLFLHPQLFVRTPEGIVALSDDGRKELVKL